MELRALSTHDPDQEEFRPIPANIEPPSTLMRFLAEWLKMRAEFHGHNEYVDIEDILSGTNVLQNGGNTVESIADEVKFVGLESRVTCDDTGKKLRLRDETEQLRLVVEEVVCGRWVNPEMTMLEVMRQPLVAHWLTAFGAHLWLQRSAMLRIAVHASNKLILNGVRIAPRSWYEPQRRGPR